MYDDEKTQSEEHPTMELPKLKVTGTATNTPPPTNKEE